MFKQNKLGFVNIYERTVVNIKARLIAFIPRKETGVMLEEPTSFFNLARCFPVGSPWLRVFIQTG